MAEQEVTIDLLHPDGNILRYDGTSWHLRKPSDLSQTRRLDFRGFNADPLPEDITSKTKTYRVEMTLKATPNVATVKYDYPSIDPSLNMTPSLSYDPEHQEPILTFDFTADSTDEAKEIAIDKLNWALNHSLYSLGKEYGPTETGSGTLYSGNTEFKNIMGYYALSGPRVPARFCNSPMFPSMTSATVGGVNYIRSRIYVNAAYARRYSVSIIYSDTESSGGKYYQLLSTWINSDCTLKILPSIEGSNSNRIYYDKTTNRFRTHAYYMNQTSADTSHIVAYSNGEFFTHYNNGNPTQDPDMYEPVAMTQCVFYKTLGFLVTWDNNTRLITTVKCERGGSPGYWTAATTSLDPDMYQIHLLGAGWNERASKYYILVMFTYAKDVPTVKYAILTDDETHANMTLFVESQESYAPSTEMIDTIKRAQYGSECFEYVEREVESGVYDVWFMGTFACRIDENGTGNVSNVSHYLWCHWKNSSEIFMRCLNENKKWYQVMTIEEARDSFTSIPDDYLALDGLKVNFSSGLTWAFFGAARFYWDDSSIFITRYDEEFNENGNEPYENDALFKSDYGMNGHAHWFGAFGLTAATNSYTITAKNGDDMSTLAESCAWKRFTFPSLYRPPPLDDIDYNLENPKFSISGNRCTYPYMPLFMKNKVQNTNTGWYYTGEYDNLWFTFKIEALDGSWRCYPKLEKQRPVSQAFSLYETNAELVEEGTEIAKSERRESNDLVLRVDGVGGDGRVFTANENAKIKFKSIDWNDSNTELILNVENSDEILKSEARSTLPELLKYYGKITVDLKFVS